MKIGIITLNDFGNYGNRLQAYALPYYLNKLFEDKKVVVENIFFTKSNYFLNNRIINPKFIRKYIFNRHGFRDQVNKNQPFFDIVKQYNFKNFTDKYIPTNYSYNFSDDIAKEYQCFVIGSDQIWNPYLKYEGDIFIYKFMNSIKRISYAASFGVNEIPDDKKQAFINMLNHTDNISVRENSGAEIIKTLVNKDVPVLIDPTLLLTKAEWLNIAEKPLWYKDEKILFVYYINDMPKKVKKEIKELAEVYDLKVINIMDRSNFDYYTISPQQFIYLINKASLVYTDSFHGTVFSILMQVPFVTCPRENASMDMNSRIETLLELFKMKNRYAKPENGYRIEKPFDIDFTQVDDIITKEQQKSYQFLVGAFNNIFSSEESND